MENYNFVMKDTIETECTTQASKNSTWAMYWYILFKKWNPRDDKKKDILDLDEICSFPAAGPYPLWLVWYFLSQFSKKYMRPYT